MDLEEQVPEIVISGISDYYKKSNANTHGEFITSIETDEVMDEVREKLSIFLVLKIKIVFQLEII